MLCKNLTVQFLDAAEYRIRGHPTRLQQGFWNVINNPVKIASSSPCKIRPVFVLK
jgi:hypothetical protein